MDLLPLAYGLLLLIAGVSDYRKREVPDLVSSIMWLSCILLPAAALPVVVACFALLFFCNASWVAFKNQVAYAWADILLFPTYAGFIVAIFPNAWAWPLSVFLALPVAASGLIMARTEKGQPFVAYLAAFYLVALAVSAL